MKRRRGSQHKIKVVVMTESTPLEGKKEKKDKPRRVSYLKMIAINDLKALTKYQVVKKNIRKEAIIDSDDSTSYANLVTIVKNHRLKVFPSKETGKMLFWINIVINNTKLILLDMHYGIKPEYLKNYLNQFYYKLNRYFEVILFNRLPTISINYQNQFR